MAQRNLLPLPAMRGAPQRLLWLSALLPLRSNDRVLEIGCGNGQLLALLVRHAPRATFIGIDRSALQVRRAVQMLSSLPAPPPVHHLALEDAPTHLSAERFTLIVAMNVNVVWTDPAVAGEALRALLAPRGRVLIGFEPPTPSGRTDLQAKLARAVSRAGFTQHTTHDDTASSTFAIEWRVPPKRTRTSA